MILFDVALIISSPLCRRSSYPQLSAGCCCDSTTNCLHYVYSWADFDDNDVDARLSTASVSELAYLL